MKHRKDKAMQHKITAEAHVCADGDPAYVIWLTGLSGSGKSTIAAALRRELFSQGTQACVLDGDDIRRGLCSDLAFSPEDRKENVRRVGEVARLLADTGIVAIVALISPYRIDRQRVRNLVKEGQFIEVYLNAPIEICEQRDPKGLYAKARAGELKEFTGVSAPYEPPERAEIELRTDKLAVAESVMRIMDFLTAARSALLPKRPELKLSVGL